MTIGKSKNRMLKNKLSVDKLKRKEIIVTDTLSRSQYINIYNPKHNIYYLVCDDFTSLELRETNTRLSSQQKILYRSFPHI